MSISIDICTLPLLHHPREVVASMENGLFNNLGRIFGSDVMLEETDDDTRFGIIMGDHKTPTIATEEFPSSSGEMYNHKAYT